MPPLTHVLCGVDRSDASHHAVLQAARIAARAGARLTLLHAAQTLHIPPPDAVASTEFPLSAADEGRVHAWLDGEVQAARELGAHAEFAIVKGAPDRALLARAAATDVNLMVVGTHGHSGVTHMLLGSVAEKVLRQATCPVLTVPPAAAAAEAVARFSRVLCAIDFSECSLRALEFALTSAVDPGAEVTLAHVIEWPWHEPPAPTFAELPATEAAALRRFRERREHEAVARLSALEPQGDAERCAVVVAHGKPYVELLRIASEQRADLIVLGVHGRSAPDMWLFGSSANQLVRRATCPVLTVRH